MLQELHYCSYERGKELRAGKRGWGKGRGIVKAWGKLWLGTGDGLRVGGKGVGKGGRVKDGKGEA